MAHDDTQETPEWTAYRRAQTFFVGNDSVDLDALRNAKAGDIVQIQRDIRAVQWIFPSAESFENGAGI